MARFIKILVLLSLITTYSCSSDNQSEQPPTNIENPSTDRTCQFNINFISSGYRIDLWVPNLSGGLTTETLFRDNSIPLSNSIFVNREYQNVNNEIFTFKYLNSSGSTTYFFLNYKVKFKYLIDGLSGIQGNTNLSVPANKTITIKLDPTKKISLTSTIE